MSDAIWRRYQLVEFDDDVDVQRTDVCVIEAPSPGVAVEYFLACHGIMYYHRIELQEVDLPPDDRFAKADVLELIPNAEDVTAEYDNWHEWEEKK